MLIELERISGDGAEIDFANRNGSVPRYILSRPKSLHLPKRPVSTFNPTLSSTPEDTRKTLLGGLGKQEWDPTRSGSNPQQRKTIAQKEVAEGIQAMSIKPCFYRLPWRWRKLLRKRPGRSSNTVIGGPERRRTPSFYRRRAATVSAPPSLFGKENKREWGEERHDDVVYTVVLEKVEQASTPTTDVQPSDGLQYVTQKVRYIKGASLPHLVAQLCQSQADVGGWSESNFLTVFLATYRSFTSAPEVLELVIKEKEKLTHEPIEKRRTIIRSIVQVLQTWLEKYFDEDFYEPAGQPLLKRVCSFAEDLHADEELGCDQSGPFYSECDFLSFAKAMLQKAEMKNMQERAPGNMTSPYSDILAETEDANVDEDSTQCFLLNSFSPQHVAEQLTIKDAELLVRVPPHHCLKAARSSKEKPATVKATIDQFNRVVYCVMGTCLDSRMKMSQRAKVISKWIEVAQACQELRNFSSLYAIVSGLTAHSIHRLKRTWQMVSSGHITLFEDLKKINPKTKVNNIHLQEKSATTSSRLLGSTLVRRNHTMNPGVYHGTVPYLGWFLTDLVHLHTARPDYIEKNLINFSKMRKEFEMLAQLQLWQASCRSYKQFESDESFSDWFSAVTLPTDEQANQRSEEIEPQRSLSPTPGTPVRSTLSNMLANQMIDVSGLASPRIEKGHNRSSSNDASQLRLSDNEGGNSRSNGHVFSEGQSKQEERSVNVQLIKRNNSIEVDTSWMKEMKLSTNDRSPAFMKKAFSLFNIEDEDSKNFQLVQIIPDDKDLFIPENGNVFYAMNSSTKEYHFALLENGAEIPREKRENWSTTLPRQGKKKKRTRKTASTSSMSSTVSPIKTIYRHLGKSGMTSTSGSYSPAKELQRQESVTEDKSSLTSLSPQLGRRKKSLEDSAPSSNTNTTSEEDDSSTNDGDSGLKGKMKKLMRKRKTNKSDYRPGHSRTHSKGTADAILFPFKMFQPIDVGSDQDDVTTLSRGQSSLNSSDSFQSGAFEKAKNEAESCVEERIKSPASPSKSAPNKSKSEKALEKRESRSKFYFSISSSSQSNASEEIENCSHASMGSELRLAVGVQKDDQPPLITVQCPSPIKSLKPIYSDNGALASSSDEESSDSATVRRRCASETRTTFL